MLSPGLPVGGTAPQPSPTLGSGSHDSLHLPKHPPYGIPHKAALSQFPKVGFLANSTASLPSNMPQTHTHTDKARTSALGGSLPWVLNCSPRGYYISFFLCLPFQFLVIPYFLLANSLFWYTIFHLNILCSNSWMILHS